MQVNIHRIDKSLPLPEYHSAGAAAFDLYSRIDIVCPPQAITRIPTNLIIETPEEYALIVALRSSSPKRKGLLHPAGPGIVDSDYRGPEDEVHVQVYNFTDQEVTIGKGERFAQAMFTPVPKVIFNEIDQVSSQSRGGFGSTGV